MTYSGMPEGHTTIGAERFHFRVRNGIGWFPLAIAARQTFRVRSSRACARLHRSPIWFVFRSNAFVAFTMIETLVATAYGCCSKSTPSHQSITCGPNHLRLYGQASRAISTG